MSTFSEPESSGTPGASPDSASIQEQLERICASREFRNKSVMKRLLTYLVTEYAEGRADLIKAYSIAVNALNRSADFDPDRDALVRVNAGRLRTLLRTYYLDEGKQDPVHIDIPKGGYVPYIRRHDENGGPAPGTTSNARRPCVAVLPFRNLAGNEDLDYMAVGLAQELSDALTKFDDFRIIGMGKRLEDDDATLPDADSIGDKGIRFLLDGDVQASQGEARIGVRLIDTSDGSSLWGNRFQFSIEKDELFEIQEAITKQVARNIGGEYGKINQRRFHALLQSKPRSLSEQDVLLKYYHHNTVLTQESADAFRESVFTALEREPDSCLLNAFAGDIYGSIYSLDFPGADEAREKFAHYIEKAYSINPNHQLVRSSLAYKCLIFDERERFFRLLDEGEGWTAPSPLRLGGFAVCTCLFGEWERGKKLLDRVFDNNLHFPGWLHAMVALYHYRRSEYENALKAANKCQIPGLHWGYIHRTVALSQLGRLEEARSEFQALLESRPNFVGRGRYLIGILIREASLLEHILDGFRRIGVEVS